jgi:four helix bundle protein
MNFEPTATDITCIDGTCKKGKPREIRERVFQYALRAIKLYQHLQRQKDGAGWILGKQYPRAACSIGANIEEAQSGESRADFIHKLGIAEKEARESLYWLRLTLRAGIVSAGKLDPLMKETEELIAVLASIILSARGKRSLERGSGVSIHNS